MENRLGIKDIFIFALLGIIILMVGLAMVQYERQWTQILALKQATSDLTNDLTGIRNQLNNGIQVSGGGPTTAPAGEDPFLPIREAMKMDGFAYGDAFIDNFGTNIGKLTPLLSTDVYAAWVQAKSMESLCYRDPKTLKYVPLLASKFEVSEDGKTMTFDLRRGVVFSDGKPMTAADVVFTFDLIRNPDIDAPRARAYLVDLESVAAEGDYRVVFKWKKFAFNAFSTVVETLVMPKHFYERYMTDARSFNDSTGLLLGTGPYRLSTPSGWTPGQRVELVRNERYWGTKPAIDKLAYFEVKDDIAEETLFRNRELDRFAPTPEQFEKLKLESAVTDKAIPYQYYSPVSGYTYISWNQNRNKQPTIFADKRVRQAMTMLFDRERLARDLYLGHATVASGPFGYGSPQTDPTVKPWPFDPEKAKALLKEVGYEDRNGDGVIEDASGKPFKFTIMYGAGNPFTERIVLFAKDSFAAAGIKCELDAVDWPIMLKRLTNHDFDASTLGWSTSIETDPNQIFHSSQIADNGDNVISYANPALDAAIDKARATVDEAERMKAWNAVHRIIHEDQPYTFLLIRQSLAFIDKRVKNVQITKMGTNNVLTELMPLPWYVPSGEQLHKN